jgi:hypothetical protein
VRCLRWLRREAAGSSQSRRPACEIEPTAVEARRVAFQEGAVGERPRVGQCLASRLQGVPKSNHMRSTAHNSKRPLDGARISTAFFSNHEADHSVAIMSDAGHSANQVLWRAVTLVMGGFHN